MKSRVKYGHLRNAGKGFETRIYAPDVMGIVQGGQLDTCPQNLHHIGIYEHRVGELFASVHHPVTHRTDFRFVLYHPVIGRKQHGDNMFHRHDVVQHLTGDGHLGPVMGFMHQHRSAHPDARNHPFG
jgi:hypothetical protein